MIHLRVQVREALSPNIDTLGVRASKYEFGGGHNLTHNPQTNKTERIYHQ